MKGNDLMNAMNGIDERFLTESELTVKKSRKLSKKALTAFVSIAAAAAFTIPAGVFAYSQLINRDTVKMYLNDADSIEESGLTQNQVMENEHLRITLDTLLSDGYTAVAVITLDAFDDSGRIYIQNHPYIKLRNPADGSYVFPSGSGSMANHMEQQKTDTIRYYQTMDLQNVDCSCDYEMIFFDFDNSLGDGFIARVSFAENTETVRLKNERGNELLLSQFEIVNTGEAAWDGLPESFAFLKNDGTKEIPEQREFLGTGPTEKNPMSTLFFGKFIDLAEYKGVEIDGVEYLK